MRGPRMTAESPACKRLGPFEARSLRDRAPQEMALQLIRLVLALRRVGDLDQHLGVVPVLLEEGDEVRLRPGGRHHRLLLQERRELRIGEHAHELGIELGDDRRRRALGRREAPPAEARIGQAGFREGRHVGQQRRALGRGDGERLDLAGRQQAEEIADAHLGDLQLAGDQLLGDRAAAAVRNADDVGAPFPVDPAQEQIRIGARPERAVVERVRLRLARSFLSSSTELAPSEVLTNRPSTSRNRLVIGTKSLSGS